MDYNIVTRGQILKRMRTGLGLKQEELSGDEITRNLISMIENDKAALTDKAAKVIYNNLERVIEEKGIYTQIDIGEIFVKEEDQVAQICDEFIYKIEKSNIKYHKSELNDIIYLLNNYNMNRYKMKVYAAIAKKNMESGERGEAFRYYIMALEFGMYENSFDEEYLNVLMDFSKTTVEEERVKEIIKSFDFYLRNVSWEENGVLRFKALIKKAQLLFDIKNYIEMNETLSKINLDEIENIDGEYVDEIKLMRARCSYEIGLYNKSSKIYSEILESCGNSPFSLESSVYIAHIKDKFSEDYSEDMEYVEKMVKDDIAESDTVSSARVNLLAGELFRKIGMIDNSLRCYEKAIKKSRALEKYKLLDYILQELLDIAKLEEDQRYLEIAEKAFDGVLKIDHEYEFKAVFKLMDLYMHRNKNFKVEDFVRKIG